MGGHTWRPQCGRESVLIALEYRDGGVCPECTAEMACCESLINCIDPPAAWCVFSQDQMITEFVQNVFSDHHSTGGGGRAKIVARDALLS